MEDKNQTVFEIVETIEQESIKAGTRRNELEAALEQLNKQQQDIASQLNFFTGALTQSHKSATAILEAVGLTLDDYQAWKALKDAPPDQTEH